MTTFSRSINGDALVISSCLSLRVRNAKTLLFTLIFLILIILAHSAFASDPAFRETYGEGRKLMEAGQWAKALETFKPLEKDYSLLGDYVLLDMAACYEKSGDSDNAVSSLRKILSGFKRSPLYRKAYRRILETGKSKDPAAALADFDLYLKEFPQDSTALWDKTELLERAGREAENPPLWKELFLSGSSSALKAYEALKTRGYRPSYEEVRKAASSLMEKENYRLAASLLEGIGVKDEEGKYILGRTYFRLRRYRDAINILSGVALKDSQYLFALSLIRTNEKGAFYRFTEEMAKDGQKDFFSLQLLAAELRRRDGNFTEASAILDSLSALYPEGKDEIAWSQSWLAVRKKAFKDAETLLSGLASRNTKERDKYLFWLGKVKNYRGQKEDKSFSRMKDKSGYYWFRAGSKEIDPPSVNNRKILKAEGITQIPEELNRNFLRIADLEGLKMRAEARTEARTMMGVVTEPYLAAYAGLLTTLEDFPTLVKLGIKYDYATLKYPLAFRDTVFKYAQAQKIDPFLVMAVMREESHFQHDAVSSAGALGVMQLMPATARRMGNVKNDGELFDVEKNIRMGTTYLAGLIAQFKSLHHAVAAYNAGERNVEKWLATGYRDEDEFTEDIPFGETKNYVFKVMRTYGMMKSLYGGDL